MDGGWTLVSNAKRSATTQNNSSKTKVEKKEVEEEPPVLNDVFVDANWTDVKESTPEVKENVWTAVTTKKKNKKKKRQKEKLAEQAETKQMEKKKVESKPKPAERTEAEIRKKNDEKRARREMKRGDSLLYYYDFEADWVKAKVIQTTADSLTLTFDGMQKLVNRNDRIIKPIWNNAGNCYYPSPKKKKKDKKPASEPEPKKEKKKKQKKKGPKKVTTESAILQQISDIIHNYGNGDKLGLPEVMNYLRDHLQGGSWKGPKYKKKFGTLKKFLQKHKDQFIVTDNNGNIEITRLPPPPPKLQKDPSQRAFTKPGTPRKSGGNSSIVFMFITLLLIFAAGVAVFYFDGENETLKKLQGRLQQIIFSSTSSKKEL